MDIYEISYTSNEDITGVSPQASFRTGLLPDDTLRRLQKMGIENVKSTGLILPPMSLHDGANFTDVLDTYAIGDGWIVSEELYNCISKLRSFKLEFLPILVCNQTREAKYYWINIVQLDNSQISKFIDLNKSNFERFPIGEKVKLRNAEDYEKNKFNQPGTYVRWNNLNVDSAIFDTYDIVKFGLGRSSMFCLSQIAALFKSFNGLVLSQERSIHLY